MKCSSTRVAGRSSCVVNELQTNRDSFGACKNSETHLVLDACPDADWRLLVALSRYGGLRCPSEHLALLWADVDWDRQRFLVRSPKTGERWVPFFPELRAHLEAAFEQTEAGAVYVIAKHRDTNINLRTRFMAIIRRAGLTPSEYSDPPATASGSRPALSTGGVMNCMHRLRPNGAVVNSQG